MNIEVHHCMKDKRVAIYRQTDEDGNQHIYLCTQDQEPPDNLSKENIDRVAILDKAGDILTYKCPFIVNMARMPTYRSRMKDFEGQNIGQ